VAASRAFRRTRAGTLVVQLEAHELALFGRLCRELRELLASADTEGAVDRLFPRAYLDPTEEEREVVWQATEGSSLHRDRLDALDLLVDLTDTASQRGSGSVQLDARGEAAWLGVLNDVRLVIGDQIGVTDDDDGDRVPADDPRSGLAVVYDWLTGLEAELVDLLLDELPETAPGEEEAGP
jgi:hypothetical protein